MRFPVCESIFFLKFHGISKKWNFDFDCTGPKADFGVLHVLNNMLKQLNTKIFVLAPDLLEAVKVFKI
jgi:hypothetical protein